MQTSSFPNHSNLYYTKNGGGSAIEKKPVKSAEKQTTISRERGICQGRGEMIHQWADTPHLMKNGGLFK
jgi:hypothetical protein